MGWMIRPDHVYLLCLPFVATSAVPVTNFDVPEPRSEAAAEAGRKDLDKDPPSDPMDRDRH